jgi:hypothetical protein
MITSRSIPQPVPISAAVSGKAEQEGTIVAAVCDVIELPGKYVSAGAGHKIHLHDSLKALK